MTAHIHAKQMAEYAEDALKTDKPWELWEYYNIGGFGVWYDFNKHPQWMDNVKYRRKQKINLDNAPKKITPFKLLKEIDPCVAKIVKRTRLKKHQLNNGITLKDIVDNNYTCRDFGLTYYNIIDIHNKLEKAKKEHGLT